MNEFMKMLLSLSLSGTLLLLFTMLLKQFYRERFSKCWQYYIWFIIALRFVLPFTLDTTIIGYFFETVDTAIVKYHTENKPISNVDVITVDSFDINNTQSYSNNEIIIQKQPIHIVTYLFFVWAVVILVLILWKIAIYQRFTRSVRAGNIEVSDIETLNLLSGCKEKLHIKRNIELYQNPLIASPVMIGFICPSIMIPDRQVTSETLSYIFTHELIHYKRKDIFYKWFIQIVICIHWFNPFVYLLGKEINKACELSCDEAVIYSLDDESKKAYGDTLLSFVKTNHTYQNSFTSLTLTEGAKQLKERLGAIMHFKRKSRLVSAITLVVTAFLLLASITVGAYASSFSNEGKPITETHISGSALYTTTPETKNSTRNIENDNRYNNDGIYDVLTYRLVSDEAPAEVQAWIRQCKSSGNQEIHIMEYKNRYWIYTEVIGASNNFNFHLSENDANECTVTIEAAKHRNGDGYALLSAPATYTHFTVKCGVYTTECSNVVMTL